MAQIEVYSSIFCPYCFRAKDLLQKKGVAFTEIDVLAEPKKREEMMRRAGGRHTVPQIFIDGKHIGGCDELYALDRRGQLDPLLQGSAP